MLIASTRALESPWAITASIPSRCSAIVRARRTNGASRQRRRPSPRLKLGDRRRQRPQRSRSRWRGRIATTTPPYCRSGRPRPPRRAGQAGAPILLLCARRFRSFRFRLLNIRKPRRRAACASVQTVTSPTETSGEPILASHLPGVLLGLRVGRLQTAFSLAGRAFPGSRSGASELRG